MGAERRFKDCVFRVEPGKPEHADHAHSGDRQRANGHRPEGQRDVLTQAAVIAHVLFVMHRVDHRSCAKEQQCLEERVGEQMEHRRTRRANASGNEHIAELRTGRIGDHPFDVPLRGANCRGEEQRRGANGGDNAHSDRADLEHR